MQALKVRVKNGRLVLDEPTDLPDGAEVEIVVIDDELTPEERAELHPRSTELWTTPMQVAAWTLVNIWSSPSAS